MHAARDLSPERAAAAGGADVPPLIAHVIHRLDVGGLENGLVNLINRMPAERYRHAIICLDDFTEFRRRIARADVPVFALHKPPGNSPVLHWRLWRLLLRLRPDIVHTRNFGTLEAALPALLAGVTARVHSEHGHELVDLGGHRRTRRWVRRAFRIVVHRYIALSKDLERYLRDKVGVPPARLVQLYNGVDTERFRPASRGREPLPIDGFAGPDQFVIGTVGRMQTIKDPVLLARSFVQLLRDMPDARRRLRLVMIGDGPLWDQVGAVLDEAGAADLAWLPGERDDVPRIMRALNLFVLPSLSEGISNTVLEAMASGLPVLATAVGGNPELVEPGLTGTLVPRGDTARMAQAIRAYVESPELCRRHGLDARRVAERRFSLDVMVKGYTDLYDRALACSRTGLRHAVGRNRTQAS
jgi:sugar transferase (PEP-CTERM/EpsH1 system associated)